uniref:Uncharacterized protein n=1 Tax=Schizaphis graminum TaxID=13262 RepID=A0A2S2PQR0_SCHGA
MIIRQRKFFPRVYHTALGVGDWPADEDHIAAAAVAASMHLVLIASSAWGRSRGSAAGRRVGAEDGEHKQNDRRTAAACSCGRSLMRRVCVRACVSVSHAVDGASERRRLMGR